MKRGLALLSVLWVLTLLALMAANVTRTTRTEINLTRNLLEQTKAEALADSGVHWAAAKLSVNHKPSVIVLKPARKMPVRIDGAPREAIGAQIRWSVRSTRGEGSSYGAATLDQNFSFVVPEPRLGYHTLTINANRLIFIASR